MCLILRLFSSVTTGISLQSWTGPSYPITLHVFQPTALLQHILLSHLRACQPAFYFTAFNSPEAKTIMSVYWSAVSSLIPWFRLLTCVVSGNPLNVYTATFHTIRVVVVCISHTCSCNSREVHVRLRRRLQCWVKMSFQLQSNLRHTLPGETLFTHMWGNNQMML